MHLLHGWIGEVSFWIFVFSSLWSAVWQCSRQKFRTRHIDRTNFIQLLVNILMVFCSCFSSRRTNKVEDGFSNKRCLTWFKQYTTANEPDVLGPDAMEQFCKDIGVDPENVVMLGKIHFHYHTILFFRHWLAFLCVSLVIAYKMNARQMGFFTQAEWQKGLTDLQCDSALKLQSKLDYLRNLMNDPNVFKNIYRYAYDFARVSVSKDLIMSC